MKNRFAWTLVVGLVAAMTASLIGYYWFRNNIEDSEADMRPLGAIANVTPAMLDVAGIVFPKEPGKKTLLSAQQVKVLFNELSLQPPVKLFNHAGFPYQFSVSRRKDQLAPHGYSYDWSVHDVGSDGKLGTADDNGQGWAGRP